MLALVQTSKIVSLMWGQQLCVRRVQLPSKALIANPFIVSSNQEQYSQLGFDSGLNIHNPSLSSPVYQQLLVWVL